MEINRAFATTSTLTVTPKIIPLARPPLSGNCTSVWVTMAPVGTWLVDTTLMETASDAWFADIDGDGITDIPVGRIPAATPADGAAVVAKLQAYAGVETGARSVLLAADQPDTFDFPAAVAQLGGLVPPGVQTTTLIRPDSGNADLLAAIDGQPTVVDYFGHGNVDSWAGAWLTSEDAASLENASHPALFVSMTCLNGYFQDASLESLAESLMKAKHGGAVAVWASPLRSVTSGT